LSSWKEHVEKINKVGLTLENLDKSTQKIRNLHASTSVDEILERSGNVDLAIVMVKSPQTETAAEKAAKLIHPTRGLVMTLQNGLGNREVLTEKVGDPSRYENLIVKSSFTQMMSTK